MAYIEPYFNTIVNDSGELLIVLKTKNKDAEFPQILFDGKHALLVRNKQDEILLTGLHPDALEMLNKNTNVLILETDSGELTLRADKYHYEEEITREYKTHVKNVKQLPALTYSNPELLKDIKNHSRDYIDMKARAHSARLTKIIISIFIFLIIGFTISKIFPHKNEYQVKSSTPEGKELFEKYNLLYKPKFTINLFFTDFYRTKGKFFYSQKIPQLGVEKLTAIPNPKVRNLKLKPDYTWWNLNGRYVVGGSILLVSIFLSWLPLRFMDKIVDTLEKAG